jgi:hypothetical protein
MPPIVEMSRLHFAFDSQPASTSLPLFQRSGITPVITRAERIGYNIVGEGNDEKNAIEASG